VIFFGALWSSERCGLLPIVPILLVGKAGRYGSDELEKVIVVVGVAPLSDLRSTKKALHVKLGTSAQHLSQHIVLVVIRAPAPEKSSDQVAKFCITLASFFLRFSPFFHLLGTAPCNIIGGNLLA
jgi:hypothetical protein